MVKPSTAATIRWLLDGDPAIRWQVLRDLTGASEAAVRRERSRVAREGWGARLLAKQDPAGTWAGGRSGDGGLYSPKWTSTTYTLLLLRDLGLPATNRQARRGCKLLLDGGLQKDGGLNYGWWGRSETCISGMGLSILAYFGCEDARLDRLLQYLLKEQMPDGGWNCRRPLGATHSSMNTTISALEGLQLLATLKSGRARTIQAAMRRGREFLLAHRLFRSHRTGNIIKSDFTRFVFPPRWHYDVLRALDHFQAVDAPRDPRLREAIEMVHERRGKDGRWSLPYAYRGKSYFTMEQVGKRSRWNTLRALRWWEQ